MYPSNDDAYPGERIETPTEGITTRRLSPPHVPLRTHPSNTPPAAPLAQHRTTTLIALGLIGFGLLLWLGRLSSDSDAMTSGMVLLNIGSVLLFFSFWKRIYGLLIPGSLLLGLSLGVPIAELSGGVSVLWGLSAGFFAILLFGRALFNVRSPWAIFPAVILFGIGVIVAFAQLPTFMSAGLVWLPLLLVGAGLYLGWGRRTA